jgi:hypothetical protein
MNTGATGAKLAQFMADPWEELVEGYWRWGVYSSIVQVKASS